MQLFRASLVAFLFVFRVSKTLGNCNMSNNVVLTVEESEIFPMIKIVLMIS